MTPSIDATIAEWQANEHEIGMIEFAPTAEADERFPYYALPADVTFLGTDEADALCLCSDGSLCVYDSTAQNRIICRAAADQSSLAAALQVLERHFDKCVEDETYCEDMKAAAAVRDRCIQLAGGDDYIAFFSSLLGV